MNTRNTATLGALLVALTSVCRADSFGTGPTAFEIEFVTVGSPGNPHDATVDFALNYPYPVGSVEQTYRIAKYETSREMVTRANSAGALGITLANMGGLRGGNRPNRPASGVTWFEAARFVDWLNTDAGYSPAYKFDELGNLQLWQMSDSGYSATNPLRNSAAKYFLPTLDEWHKAAYYDETTEMFFEFPTKSNSPPYSLPSGTFPNTAVFRQPIFNGPADIDQAGAAGPYGTIGQGGNVDEWLETEIQLRIEGLPNSDTARIVHGGSWVSPSAYLSASIPSSALAQSEEFTIGFRVASTVPEPNAIALWFISPLLFMKRVQRLPRA